AVFVGRRQATVGQRPIPRGEDTAVSQHQIHRDVPPALDLSHPFRDMHFDIAITIVTARGVVPEQFGQLDARFAKCGRIAADQRITSIAKGEFQVFVENRKSCTDLVQTGRKPRINDNHRSDSVRRGPREIAHRFEADAYAAAAAKPSLDKEQEPARTKYSTPGRLS